MKFGTGVLLAAIALAGCSAAPPAGSVQGSEMTVAAGTRQADAFGGQVNAQRRQAGLGSLVANGRLAAASERHAADMAARGYFSHRSPDGAGIGERAKAAGYCFRGLAENIAAGQDSPAEALAAWMNSPGHRRNILDASYTDYGLGRAGKHWVMMLGRPC